MNRPKSIITAIAAVMAFALCGCENVIVDGALSLLDTNSEMRETAEFHAAEETESDLNLGVIGFHEGEKISLLSGNETKEEVSQEIIVNSSGYESTGEKLAIFRGENSDETFEVVDTKTEEVVFTGYIVEVRQNKKNGESNARGDFSSLTKPGDYCIRTKNHGKSASFTIEKGYYQRLLEERKRYFSDLKINISDPTQFNRSIMQTADWLLTYEFFTKMTADSRVPEMLTLAAKGIEALQGCQDEKTGQVMAGEPATLAQTYRYAAVISMFADAYDNIDADYAAKCKESAVLAWEYANEQTMQESAKDEHYWAAAQLYKLTGEETYLSVVKDYTSGEPLKGFSEEETGYLGSLAYLTTSYKTELKLSNRIMKSLLDDAITIVNESEKDGYLVACLDAYNEENVQWAFSNARLLTLANVVSKSVDYVDSAGWHLEYLYGRNPYMKNYANDEESVYYNEPQAFILSGMIHSYILYDGL